MRDHTSPLSPSAVVCPLTCLNGGVCSSRKHCLCPPGFTGRLCQFPLQQTQQAQAARGNKQPVYPISLKPDSMKLVEQSSIARTQMMQTHSIFTLPLTQTGHHSSEGIYYSPPCAASLARRGKTQFRHRFNALVFSADQFACPPHARHLRGHPTSRSIGSKASPQDGPTPDPLQAQTEGALLPGDHAQTSREFRQAPHRRMYCNVSTDERLFCDVACFFFSIQCNSTPLPVLTNQEDCCGSVGNSWGQNKCYQCPKLPSE